MSSIGETNKEQKFLKHYNVEKLSTRMLKKLQWILYDTALVISDVLLIAAAFRVAYWLRFELFIPIFQLNVEPSLAYYERLVMYMLPIWITIFALMGLYHQENLLGGTKEYALLWRGTTFCLLLFILIGFLEPNMIIARGFLLLAWGLSFLFAGSSRFILRRIVYQSRSKGFFSVPALIIGTNQEGRLLAQQILDWKSSGLQLQAWLSADGDGHNNAVGDGIYYGSLDELDDVVKNLEIREMILATSALSREEMLSIFNQYGLSDKVNLRLSSGLFEIITTGLRVKELAYVPLVSVEKVRLTGLNRLSKLALDLFLSTIGIILLSPLLLVVPFLVKLDSKGPIFHRRRVMGLNSIEFDAFKFRTMFENADEILDSNDDLKREFDRNHKLEQDPRVTKLGAILRRYSIDELPQLFNVIRGEMSLVGPRMISPEEMPKYGHWGLNLLTIKPGITGLWQVSGRSDISYEERVKMDMYYIRNWTMWFDLYLLIQTIPAVIKARGAY